MRCILLLFFLVCCSLGKKQVIYKATGAGVFDLIRGIPPKSGALEVTPVEEADPASLPDGIYFVQEDAPLDEEKLEKLYVTKSKDKDVSEKKPVPPESA